MKFVPANDAQTSCSNMHRAWPAIGIDVKKTSCTMQDPCTYGRESTTEPSHRSSIISGVISRAARSPYLTIPRFRLPRLLGRLLYSMRISVSDAEITSLEPVHSRSAMNPAIPKSHVPDILSGTENRPSQICPLSETSSTSRGILDPTKTRVYFRRRFTADCGRRHAGELILEIDWGWLMLLLFGGK